MEGKCLVLHIGELPNASIFLFQVNEWFLAFYGILLTENIVYVSANYLEQTFSLYLKCVYVFVCVCMRTYMAWAYINNCECTM